MPTVPRRASLDAWIAEVEEVLDTISRDTEDRKREPIPPSDHRR
jgi:hypothetical protein